VVASVQLTGPNTIAGGAPLMVTNAGSGFTAAPTTGTVTNGTASSCTASSLTVSTALGGALDLLSAVQPVLPSGGHGRVWFDSTLANATTAMQNRQFSAASSRMAAVLSQWAMSCLAAGALSGIQVNH